MGIFALPVEVPFLIAILADVASAARASLAGVPLCMGADTGWNPHVFSAALFIHQVGTEAVHYLGFAQALSHCVLVVKVASLAALQLPACFLCHFLQTFHDLFLSCQCCLLNRSGVEVVDIHLDSEI
jgi:hypothetical protein